MQFSDIYEQAIAQAVPASAVDQMANVNVDFVKRLVNKAYHVIERAALWKFSEAEVNVTAAANTRVCADVPADFGIPLTLKNTSNDTELVYHDDRQRWLNPDTVGTVQAYSLWAGELRWWPLAQSEQTISMRYYKYWADLNLDADEPIIPEAFHDLLVDYATGYLILRLPATGDRFLPNSKAEPYLNLFREGFAQMLSSDLVIKTFDDVPNYDFVDYVLDPENY